jgi:hypothetical protein
VLLAFLVLLGARLRSDATLQGADDGTLANRLASARCAKNRSLCGWQLEVGSERAGRDRQVTYDPLRLHAPETRRLACEAAAAQLVLPYGGSGTSARTAEHFGKERAKCTRNDSLATSIHSE